MNQLNRQPLFTRLDTVIIRVRSLDTACFWYQNVLGLRPVHKDLEKEKLAVLDTGGQISLTIWQLKPGEQFPPHGTVGSYPILLSEDIVAARETLQERGVDVEEMQVDDCVNSFGFYDPDGNRFEVCQINC